jgi:zinc transport system ATP-binding protein
MNQKHPSCMADNGRCGSCCTRIENFGVTAGNTTILENVNLHIHCGELTAIIGPNGAGKSTLLKAILGEIRHSGELHFLSCAAKGHDKPILGYVPQKLDFDLSTPTSVADLFAACGSRRPVWLSRSRRIYEIMLEDLKRVQSEYLADRRLGELSGGELQRVLLALALEPVPDILLLDEPVSGMDRKGTALFYNTVSDLREKYDLSIILISHDFDLVAQYADRVVLLNKTILEVGTPSKVFGSDNAKELFGDVSGIGSKANATNTANATNAVNAVNAVNVANRHATREDN